MSLTHKSRLKPGGPLRRRSKNPKSVTKLGLVRKLGKWCRDYGECIRCGSYDPRRQAHHVYTRGSTCNLTLCPDNVVPLCFECHQWVHANPAQADMWLEKLKPGLLSHLCRLSRGQEWHKKDLDEAARLIDSLPCFRDYFARRVA